LPKVGVYQDGEKQSCTCGTETRKSRPPKGHL
jgi:hypothetical protein